MTTREGRKVFIWDGSSPRFVVMNIHRRGGKTVASLNHLQRDALTIPKSRWAYIAPTYKQAKNVAWDLLKGFSRMIPGIKFNEAELTVFYPNGSKLTLYGADNPDSLRGIGLHGVIFDEYALQPSNIFTEIILPTLADHEGYAIWISTPKGKNDFYKMCVRAQNDDKWKYIELKSSVSGIIGEEELKMHKSIMDEDEFNQEYECSFEATSKGAYYKNQLQAARKEGRIGKIPYEMGLPVHTWWDLGVSDSTTIGFFQVVGKEWRIIDYYEASGEGLEHFIAVLKNKPYIYGNHYAPHDIVVREFSTGQSRYETASNLGIDFEMVHDGKMKSAVPKFAVQDGIQAVRRRFNTLWIDEKNCERLVTALSQYRKEWNDKMGSFKDKPLHDWTSHAADMLRYWAVTEHVDYKQFGGRDLNKIRSRKRKVGNPSR